MKVIKLNEHYVTLFDKDLEEKKKLLDEVWAMLENSYAKIGGIKGSTKEDLLKPGIMWKIVRRGGKPVAVCIYKHSDIGRKTIAGGCDGSPEGKKGLYDISWEDLSQKDRHAWAEVSGAIEHIFVDKLGAKPYSVEEARTILHKLGKELTSTNSDGIHYTRKIDGEDHEKTIVGNVPNKLLK